MLSRRDEAEPVRCGWDLHLTNIRNEHAYYCCVAQLMEYIELPIDTTARPLFMCGTVHPVWGLAHCVGDSHSLSSAWHTRTINVRLLRDAHP